MQNRVIFTSNCFGEDRSAAIIARSLSALTAAKPSLSIEGASLISEGKDYTSRGVKLLFSSYVPPSGGFPTRSLKGLIEDLKTGGIANTFRFVKTLKAAAPETRVAVVVGDIALLLLTRWGMPKVPIVFLAPAKSDYIEPHYGIEEWVMRKNCDIIWTHDEFTAANLRKKRLNAVFAGNPMMDELEPASGWRFFENNGRMTVGLLPGSREEAYDNFVRILDVASQAASVRPLNLLAGLPGTLTNERLAECLKPAGWVLTEADGKATLSRGPVSVLLSRGRFADVLHHCDFFIALAGTAVEQAAGMGKPIISFTGVGPQTTVQRMEEQERLLGGAMKFARRYPDEVLAETLLLCDSPGERLKRGEAGRERMGAPGGAETIARYIFQNYLK